MRTRADPGAVLETTRKTMSILLPTARTGAAALFACATTGALACSTCGCTLDADWATQGVTTRTGWTADLRFDFLDQDDLRSGTGRVDRGAIALPADDEIQQRTVNRDATLTLDRGIDQDWGVTVQLPWIRRYHTTIAEGDTGLSTSRSDSLGDARVIARYTGFSDALDWGVQFGLKLPTGDSHGVDFSSGPQTGEMLDRGLQPGTGSTDLLLGVFRFGTLGPSLDWFGQGQLQVPVAHDRAFRPGNAVSASAGVRWKGLGAVVPQAQLNVRHETRESGDASDEPNSGSTLAYFSPGATWTLTPQASVYVFGQVPVYQRVDGLQLEPKWSASAGVHFAF
jgi:hypothetical protein